MVSETVTAHPSNALGSLYPHIVGYSGKAPVLTAYTQSAISSGVDHSRAVSAVPRAVCYFPGAETRRFVYQQNAALKDS